MSEDFTRLKGGYEITDTSIVEATELNMADFLSWGLLGIGGYTNVYRTSSGAYGRNLSTLALVKEPNYASGQVFEGFRGNWVWETGVEHTNPPIQISGIYINNTFYNINTTGAYSYNINYPLGRVIFNNPINVNSTVQVEHSFKKVSVVTAGSKIGKYIMTDTYRPDRNGFGNYGSGIYNILGQSRLQLPCIVVKAIDVNEPIPMQIGGGHYADIDVLFYIFSEDGATNRLKSILTNQKDKTIYFYDRDSVNENGRYALNYQGYINPSGYLAYPQLVNPPAPNGDGFRWKRCFIKKTRSQDDTGNTNLQTSVVRYQLEIDMYEI